MQRLELERATGELFEQLWSPYEVDTFAHSVSLFQNRLEKAGFDQTFFKGATVLDAGCGGGRNTIAMAGLGARMAHGIDIGARGIEDARERAADLPNTDFQVASILDIPFADEHFDLVWCAGVLMITDDEHRALRELTRVLKPGGILYLLVYADEGVRWPLINVLRPIARLIGRPEMDRTMRAQGTASNKRRTFLDDLFCPKLDFYNWPRLQRMLEKDGYERIERWGDHVRLDHEHNLGEYGDDLQQLLDIFQHGTENGAEPASRQLFRHGRDLIAPTVDLIRWTDREVAEGRMAEDVATRTIIGQGHHRVMAHKPSNGG